MNKKLRSGVTLIELLIVVALVVLLAGMVLPTLKGVLKDSQVPQCARVVQGYAETARARAIASGRRTALILERLRADAAGGLGTDGLIANETCTRLSIGEVFPPYEGDWADSSATPVSISSTGFVNAIQIPIAQAATLVDFSVSPPVPNGFVTIGDLVELGDRSQGFIVSGAPTIIAGLIQIPLANAPSVTLPSGGFAISNEPNWPLTPEMSANGLRFRIFRKPSKTMAGSVTLPRGTCIDISCSGVGPSGRDFSAAAINASTGVATTAGDFGPIYIVFNPRGTVDVAYFQSRTATGGGSVAVGIQRVLPTGVFHLMVGRTEQVQPADMLAPYTNGSLSSRDNFQSNLIDSSNTWVSINPYSGNIYSSRVNEVVIPSNPALFTIPFRVAQSRINAMNTTPGVGF